MADEEDENAPSKVKKEKEKDQAPELAPGEVINPAEYKMFDKINMQKTLEIPQRLVYSFQKELAGTLQKRLETIRLKHGADDAKQVAETKDAMEITAGLQAWEAVDPVSGQLLESLPQLGGTAATDAKTATAISGQPTTGKPGAVSYITPSVLNVMRAGLPKAKVEDRSAMPAVNRRLTATEVRFQPGAAVEDREYGDYYETMDKLDKIWKTAIGKRSSVLKTEKRQEPLKPKEPQKRRASMGAAEATVKGHQLIKPWTVKSKLQKAGVPPFMDGVITYFMDTVSPDCNLESWLTPVNITPVFKIKDVPPEIENTVVTIARVTHSKFIDDQGIALQIRSALEKHHGYACRWHVIVGRKFGLQVNADKGNFLFMYIGHLGYVVFRTFG